MYVLYKKKDQTCLAAPGVNATKIKCWNTLIKRCFSFRFLFNFLFGKITEKSLCLSILLCKDIILWLDFLLSFHTLHAFLSLLSLSHTHTHTQSLSLSSYLNISTMPEGLDLILIIYTRPRVSHVFMRHGCARLFTWPRGWLPCDEVGQLKMFFVCFMFVISFYDSSKNPLEAHTGIFELHIHGMFFFLSLECTIIIHHVECLRLFFRSLTE